MATIFDTAKYILEQSGSISTWKLQKLCYYAQAWSLAWDEKSLFDEDFEAWSNGPVCPALFHAHKGKFYITASELGAGNSDNLCEKEKETIDIILRDYGDMEPYELREQTHHEKPWIIARDRLADGLPCSNVITKSSMGEYYGGL